MFDKFGLMMAKRWIGGASVSDAVVEAKRINRHGERVLLNYLGEDHLERSQVDSDVWRYMELMRAMKKNAIEGSISVKPTQLGLMISPTLFEKNLETVSKAARRRGIFIWLDMEDYEFIPKIIDGYIKIHRRYHNTGICIQARTKRSLSDLKLLLKNRGRIRLVKGAYGDPGHLTFETREMINLNYIRCMEYLFRNGDGFMIATHDGGLIERAIRLRKRYKKRVEFAMLKGIRTRLAQELADDGNAVNIYVPFGEEWFAYSLRRLKEEGHLMLLIRSVLQG